MGRMGRIGRGRSGIVYAEKGVSTYHHAPNMKAAAVLRDRPQGFTLIEALFVVILIVVLLLLFLPMGGLCGGRGGADRIKCANNLKQVGLAFKVFANDHDDQLPYQTTNVVALGLDRRAWTQFMVMSNELGSPKILWCPGDKHGRTVAAEFGLGPSAGPASLARLQDNAVSYFIGVGVTSNAPNSILAGDCNLAASIGAPLYSSRGVNPFVQVPTTSTWATKTAHHDQAGNITLGDGSVQQVTTSGLQTQLKQAEAERGTNVNRLVFPQ